jgi:hypothetical protein
VVAPFAEAVLIEWLNYPALLVDEAFQGTFYAFATECEWRWQPRSSPPTAERHFTIMRGLLSDKR